MGRLMKTGPRGGLSTVFPSGLVRKTCYFYDDQWEAIRKAAYDRDMSYAEVLRLAVEAWLLKDENKNGNA